MLEHTKYYISADIFQICCKVLCNSLRISSTSRKSLLHQSTSTGSSVHMEEGKEVLCEGRIGDTDTCLILSPFPDQFC